MNQELLKKIIESNETQIIAINGALTALSNGVQEYSLNTGQSTTKVTRFDIESLNKTLQSLINQNGIYCNRLNRTGSTIGRPSW